MIWLIHLSAFFGDESHVALDRNPGPGYHTLLLRLIPGDLLTARPHRQFHTLPDRLDSRAALPKSHPNALLAMQGGSLYHFYDGLWYGLIGRLPVAYRVKGDNLNYTMIAYQRHVAD